MKAVRPYAQNELISVVIPAYNEEAGIAQSIESLKAQTYTGKLEIIVADNNSTDRTAEIVRAHGARIVLETRKGVAFARQAGFMAAHGWLIISTDADTQVPTNWVERFVQEFEKHPDAVCVSGMYKFYDGSFLLNFLMWVLNYRLFAIFHWHSGANMAVRSDAFRTIGGFNLNLHISEDSDLAERMRALGEVRRLPKFKVSTSARRFNQLGLIGGLSSYASTYIKTKLFKDREFTFQAGSESLSLGWQTRVAMYVGVFVVIFGGLLGIRPVEAEVKEHTGHMHLSKHIVHEEEKIEHTISTTKNHYWKHHKRPEIQV